MKETTQQLQRLAYKKFINVNYNNTQEIANYSNYN